MRFTIIILFIISQGAAFADDAPVGSPVSKPIFEISRELYGRGELDYFEYARPALIDNSVSNRSALAELYRGFNLFPDTPEKSAAAGLIVEESNYQKQSNITYLKLFPYVRLNFTPKLSSSILYRIDGELDNDKRYSGKSWNGVAGFPEMATIDYNSNGFNGSFGIERVSWGFAQYSNLMFAESAMPMTRLSLSYRRSFFDFESVTGFLDPLADQLDRMEHDTSFFTSQQRYISAHSISLKLFRGFSVSLREAILYGGPGRRLEAAYLFPFIWYHGQQLNSRMNDNSMASISVDYRYNGKAWLYGEYFIDDYQAENKTRGDNEPNELAYLAGFEFYDFFAKRTALGMEYSRANNWTYNQSRAHNRYINQNYPIGYIDGPDNDRLSWRGSWWLTDAVKLTYTGSYRRRGEGRIDTPWTRPWLDVDNYSEPFPTGVVEKRTENGLEIMAIDKNWLWSNIGLSLADISNVENIPGKDSRNWEFSLEIGIKIPPFIWGF
jgi:hypothetical protein